MVKKTNIEEILLKCNKLNLTCNLYECNIIRIKFLDETKLLSVIVIPLENRGNSEINQLLIETLEIRNNILMYDCQNIYYSIDEFIEYLTININLFELKI